MIILKETNSKKSKVKIYDMGQYDQQNRAQYRAKKCKYFFMGKNNLTSI